MYMVSLRSACVRGRRPGGIVGFMRMLELGS